MWAGVCAHVCSCVCVCVLRFHHAHANIWHCSSRSELRRLRAAESAAAIARRDKMLSLSHQVHKGGRKRGEHEEGREGRRHS